MGIRVIAPLGVAIAVGHAASAQVSATSGVTKFYGATNVGSFVELPGGAVAPTSTVSGGNMQFWITGDVRLNLDPDEDASTVRELIIGGVQEFTVGMFPTMITPGIIAHFKHANAGGPPAPAAIPQTFSGASVLVYTTGSYMHGSNDFSGLGELVADVSVGGLVLGNGYEVVDDAVLASDSYVLLPEEKYTVIWRMEMTSFIAGLESDGPASAAFFEAGGISDFHGFQFDLNAVVVPAPGSAVLGALACVVIGRRRR